MIRIQCSPLEERILLWPVLVTYWLQVSLLFTEDSTLVCPSDWPSSEALKQVPYPTWTHVYLSIYSFKTDLKSSCHRD